MSYDSNKKGTELDALTSLADDDVIIVSDADDSGRAKKITSGNFNDTVLADTTALDNAGVYRTGSTDVAVADGGTGESSYTKGDVLVASGATTLTKLGVGSDGQVLVADSTQSNGITWGVVSNFGDGSDGDADLDGINTYSFLTKSSNTYTMTRDTYFDDLVIPSGSTLKPANFRIFVRGTISGAGDIEANGNNGSNGVTAVDAGGAAGGAGGTTLTAGYFSCIDSGAGGAGGKNGASTVGVNGSASNPGLGSVGSAGGTGGGFRVSDPDGAAGGSGGAVTSPIQTFGIHIPQTIAAIDYALDGTTSKIDGTAGSGGGGGGTSGDTNSQGGGGGGAGGTGGFIYLCARSWTGTFDFLSTGGVGGDGGGGWTNGATGAGGGGGGAGGSGGTVVVIYNTKTWTGNDTLTAGAAGTGGSGVSGGGDTGQDGDAGTAGNTGTLTEVQL